MNKLCRGVIRMSLLSVVGCSVDAALQRVALGASARDASERIALNKIGVRAPRGTPFRGLVRTTTRLPARRLVAQTMLCAFWAAGVATVLHAEGTLPATTNDPLQEITVTATRSAVELSKVPLAVSAFTQDQLDAAGVKNVADLTQLTPGLNYVSAIYQGFESTNISIRGIDSQAGASTTGIYIDDTPVQQFSTIQAFNGQPFPKLFDLERVEVLKGPQGTLFGGGAEGGAVRFITPQPGLEQYSGFVKAEGAYTEGGSGSYEIGSAVGGPIVTDTLGFRVSAWHREDGGYVDRTSWQTGNTVSNANSQSTNVLRGALRWVASDAIEVSPAVFYQDIRRDDTSFFWTSLSDLQDGRRVSGNTLPQPSTDRMVLPSLKVEVKLPQSMLLTFSSSYLDRVATGQLDVTNYFPTFCCGVGNPFPTTPPGFYWASEVHTKQHGVTEELRLQSNNSEARVRWLVGLFFQSSSQADVENDQAPLLSELPGAVEPFDDPNTAIIKTKNTQTAIFGNVDFRLTDTITATAGVRGEHTRVDASNLFTGSLYAGATINTAGVQSETPVTPKVGLSWQPNNDTLVYANVASGFRDGGVNPPLFPACGTELPVSTSYRSDRTLSYELGTKDKLADERVQLEANLFEVRWSHIQSLVFLPCGLPYVFDGHDATIRGAELALRARVVEGLSAGLSVTYTDSKYDQTVSDGLADIIIKGTTVGDPRSGNVIPPWSIVGILEYTHEIAGHPSYLRIQDSFNSRSNGPFTSHFPGTASYEPTLPIDPSTNLLGVRLGTHFSALEATLFVDNLANSQPLLRVQQDYSTSPVYFASTFRPRTFGLSLNYKF